MLIHYLSIALIMGFTLVAAFVARATARSKKGHRPNHYLAYTWLYSAMAVFVTTAVLAMTNTPYGEDLVITPTTLYPLFALLMIVGFGFTIPWCIYQHRMKDPAYRSQALHPRRTTMRTRRRRRGSITTTRRRPTRTRTRR